MARYIDATPAQRWHQYQKPADRKLIAEAPAMIAEFQKLIGKLFAHRHKSITPRVGRRRVRDEIRQLRLYEASVEAARERLQRFG